MTAAMKWTLAIIGLLAGNLVAMAVLIGAANTGRSQVIPDYYARAVRYDDTLDQAARNQALGWQVDAQFDADTIAVTVHDRDGRPLEGARVAVAGTPRVSSARAFDTPLAESAPGRYRGPRSGQRGIYDVTITVEQADRRLVTTASTEAQ